MEGEKEGGFPRLMGREDVISFALNVTYFRSMLVGYRDNRLTEFMPNLYIKQYARIVGLLELLNNALIDEVSAQAEQAGKAERRRAKKASKPKQSEGAQSKKRKKVPKRKAKTNKTA